MSRTRNHRPALQAILTGAAAAVEPRVRTVVADRLGVEPGDLAPAVSLVEDLAADSLDLVEVALALETELGVELPDRVVSDIRTYGDLVAACAERVAARGGVAPLDDTIGVWAAPLPVHARVQGERGTIERTDVLTPYGAETIADDARRAGPNARLDVTVPAETTDAGVAAVHERFTPLVGHGVDVHVVRDRKKRVPPPARPASRPEATA